MSGPESTYSPVVVNSPLKTFDEFTRLRSIVVGTAVGANHPEIDASFENFFQPPVDAQLRARAVGPIPQLVIDEIEEDIDGFIGVLHANDVEVLRPSPLDSAKKIRTPYWESDQLYSLMPRDCLLVVGDLIVEVPSPTRSRYFETFAFRRIIEAYVQRGAHCIAAPKPMLADDDYDRSLPNVIPERELLFDAANCIRLGRDIFIDINRTANKRAAEWLARTLKGLVSSSIRLHQMSIGNDHIDVTLIPLRPGVILVDPAKVNDANLPAMFKSWDRVIVEEVMPTREYGLPYPLASNDGIGRNVLVLGPNKVIVDDVQLPLIRALERRGFEVIPLRYRHGRTLGGSWHCITLDTNREGGLESYFDTQHAGRSTAVVLQDHASLFEQHEVGDLCGLDLPFDDELPMSGADLPSTSVIDGLSRTELTFADSGVAPHRSNLLKALYAEYDAELFCREIDRRVEQGLLTLSPAFRAFERLWRRDEMDHAIGFAKLYSVLYRESEKDVLAELHSRQANFSRLEPFLADELSICLLLAYDELATTLSYADDWKTFYPQFASVRLNRWIKRLAADEARHYRNLLKVIRVGHADELQRALPILDAIHALDSQRNEYAGTFVLDHDSPEIFSDERLSECRHRLAYHLSLIEAV